MESYWSRSSRLDRRRFLRRLGGGALGTAAVISGAACAGGAPASPTAVSGGAAAPTVAPTAAAGATAAPADNPKFGGTMSTNVGGDQPHMDVHQTNNAVLLAYGPGLVYEQLFSFKRGMDVKMPNFEPSPELALSSEQPEELVYTIKLRQGVKFHNVPPVNGREFVADDVVKSLKRQIAEKANAFILNEVDKIEAVDKYSVKFTLSKGNPDFIQGLGFQNTKIVPFESWEQAGDLKNGPIIGTGPFLFEKWEPRVFTSMVRNPDYWQKNFPYIDRLRITRILEPSSLVGAFRAKELDVQSTGLQPADIDLIAKSHPEVKVVPERGHTKVMLSLKANQPPFDNLKVRQAISKAVDRQQLMDTFYPNSSFYNSGVAGANPEYELSEAEVKDLTKFDLEGAKKLMAEAGFANGFEAEITSTGDIPNQNAELIAAMLQKINIRAKLRPLDPATSQTLVTTQRVFQINVALAPPPLPLNADLYSKWHSTGNQNIRDHSDPELDKMIDQQSRLWKDPAGRNKLVKDIQRRIIDQAAFMQLYGTNTVFVQWPHVKRFNPNGNTNDSLWTYGYVWLDK
jgi:peptide/nickel transport system substrate-binding protein